MIGLGVLLGGAYVVWQVLETDGHLVEVGPDPEPRVSSGTAPTASAPSPASDGRGWVEPEDGACPVSHPVKAKLASGIYHEPAGANYRRTLPDRCYRDGATAQHDGLRRSKR